MTDVLRYVRVPTLMAKDFFQGFLEWQERKRDPERMAVWMQKEGKCPLTCPFDEYRKAGERVGVSLEDRVRWLLNFVQNPFRYRALSRAERRDIRAEWAVFKNADVSLKTKKKEIFVSQFPTNEEITECFRKLNKELQDIRLLSSNEEVFPQSELFKKSMEALLSARQLLRSCKKCNRVFVRIRRQEYCSISCRWAVNKRTFRRSASTRNMDH